MFTRLGRGGSHSWPAEQAPAFASAPPASTAEAAARAAAPKLDIEEWFTAAVPDGLKYRERAYVAERLKAITVERTPEFKQRFVAYVNRAAESSGSVEEFRFLLDAFLAGKQKKFSLHELQMAWLNIEFAQNPFTVAHDLAAVRPGELYHAADELLAFETLVRPDKTISEFAKKTNDWVKSPAHAVFLYQHLSEVPKKARGPVLEYLQKHNEYFKRVGRVRGPPNSLVTMSYEKETGKRLISMLYRDASVSEEEWGKLSEEAREAALLKLTKGYQKRGRPAEIIAPTALKPVSAGGLQEEALSREGRPLFEIAHKAYEIDPQQLVKEMREVNQLFKEADFHVHLVFELPKSYEHMQEFNAWLKQGNDYLYLKGMEEHGMHASAYIQIPDAPVPPIEIERTRKIRLAPPPAPTGLSGLLHRIRNAVRTGPEPARPPEFVHETYVAERRWVDQSWPESPYEVNGHDYKYRPAGLRAGLYGGSSDSGYKKIGIELRDPTRDMGTWEKLVNGFHSSIAGKIWEGKKLHPDSVLLSQKVSQQEMEALESSGVSRRFLDIVKEIEPTSGLPVRPYEKGVFTNFRTGGEVVASEVQAKRIAEARDRYVDSLRKLEKEYFEMNGRGEEVTFEDLKAAIRMTMSEWARDARVSELYGGI